MDNVDIMTDISDGLGKICSEEDAATAIQSFFDDAVKASLPLEKSDAKTSTKRKSVVEKNAGQVILKKPRKNIAQSIPPNFDRTRWALTKGFFDVITPVKPPRDILNQKCQSAIYKNDQLYRYKTLEQIECLLALAKYHTYFMYNDGLKCVHDIIRNLEVFIKTCFQKEVSKNSKIRNPWNSTIHLQKENIFPECITLAANLSNLSLSPDFKYLTSDLAKTSWASLPTDYSHYLVFSSDNKQFY